MGAKKIYQLRAEQKSVTSRSACGKQIGGGSGKREKYSAAEDQAILAFVEQQSSRSVNGQKLWQQAQKRAITSRSWQSMRNHFIKNLRAEFSKRTAKTLPGQGRTRASGSSDGTGSSDRNWANRDEIVDVDPDSRMEDEDGEDEDSCELVEDAQEEDMEKVQMGLTPQERELRQLEYVAMLEAIMKRTKQPKAVVVHAGIIFSGDMAMAEKYLTFQLAPEEEEKFAWSYHEDQYLMENAEVLEAQIELAGPRPPALRQMIEQHGKQASLDRFRWIHNDDGVDTEDEDEED